MLKRCWPFQTVGVDIKYFCKLGTPSQGTEAGAEGRMGGRAVSGLNGSPGGPPSTWAAGLHGRAGPSGCSPGGFAEVAYSSPAGRLCALASVSSLTSPKLGSWFSPKLGSWIYPKLGSWWISPKLGSWWICFWAVPYRHPCSQLRSSPVLLSRLPRSAVLIRKLQLGRLMFLPGPHLYFFLSDLLLSFLLDLSWWSLE